MLSSTVVIASGVHTVKKAMSECVKFRCWKRWRRTKDVGVGIFRPSRRLVCATVLHIVISRSFFYSAYVSQGEETKYLPQACTCWPVENTAHWEAQSCSGERFLARLLLYAPHRSPQNQFKQKAKGYFLPRTYGPGGGGRGGGEGVRSLYCILIQLRTRPVIYLEPCTVAI
jgi:hypothetical protein